MATQLPPLDSIEDEDGAFIRAQPVMLVNGNGEEVGPGGGAAGPAAELPTGYSIYPEYDAEEVGLVFAPNPDRISASVQNTNAFDIRITENTADSPSATVGYILKPYHTAEISTNGAVKVWAAMAYAIAATETESV